MRITYFESQSYQDEQYTIECRARNNELIKINVRYESDKSIDPEYIEVEFYKLNGKYLERTNTGSYVKDKDNVRVVNFSKESQKEFVKELLEFLRR